MGEQRTFASVAWTQKRKVTRREQCLSEMDAGIPWARLTTLIEPHYPKGGNGREPPSLEKLLPAGTIVDATIIAAPSSTKNATKTRDPEMKQTKKGKQWYFGMKLHIGTDRKGRVHHVTATAASAADITQVPTLLHGDEQVLY